MSAVAGTPALAQCLTVGNKKCWFIPKLVVPTSRLLHIESKVTKQRVPASLHKLSSRSRSYYPEAEVEGLQPIGLGRPD